MKICVLGAGFVSSGVVHFLCRENLQNDFAIVVGSKFIEELQVLQAKYPCITTVVLDVTSDCDKLREIIEGSCVVISLLTNNMHVPIAKVCIEHKVNMIHASYCTNEMMALDSLAKLNGVTILNEIGLDPGIDHFLAMRAIDQIRAEGDTRITAFISYCGGLPEPKLSESNPLKYKFSWSPRTALGNMLNSAKYLENNKVVEVPSGGALIDTISNVKFFPEYHLEGYPNRDSLVYKDLYGIEEAENVIRGTLRYRGFGKILKTLQKLGLLSSEPLGTSNIGVDEPKSWRELIMKLVLGKENVKIGSIQDNVDLVSCLFLNGYDDEEVNALEALDLLSDIPELVLKETMLDTLSEHLAPKLSFKENERDIVILKHIIKSQRNFDEEVTTREIDFIAYGDQHIGGFSAMSKTVSLTLGHATKLLLNGTIKRAGVICPFTSDIYEPILKCLESEGLIWTEKKSQDERSATL